MSVQEGDFEESDPTRRRSCETFTARRIYMLPPLPPTPPAFDDLMNVILESCSLDVLAGLAGQQGSAGQKVKGP